MLFSIAHYSFYILNTFFFFFLVNYKFLINFARKSTERCSPNQHKERLMHTKTK